MDYLLANGRILDPSQNLDRVAHLVIRGGRIAEITEALPADTSLKCL
ncbi:MAG: amidohydrolase/deacetylase family metallohydrolase, partial [Armatimonadota bacterium]